MDELTRLRAENEELTRRLKDKVTLQSVFLADAYERELEMWREWGGRVRECVDKDRRYAGFIGKLWFVLDQMPQGDDE